MEPGMFKSEKSIEEYTMKIAREIRADDRPQRSGSVWRSHFNQMAVIYLLKNGYLKTFSILCTEGFSPSATSTSMTSKRHGTARVPSLRNHSFAPRWISDCFLRFTAASPRIIAPFFLVFTSIKRSCLPSRAMISTSPPRLPLKFLASTLQFLARNQSAATFSP